MITRTKTPQLHLFPVLDLLGIAIAPFQRYFRVCVCIDQDIERAIAIELWEKGNGCGDLAEYGLDLVLDLLLRFLGWGFAFARAKIR